MQKQSTPSLSHRAKLTFLAVSAAALGLSANAMAQTASSDPSATTTTQGTRPAGEAVTPQSEANRGAYNTQATPSTNAQTPRTQDAQQYTPSQANQPSAQGMQPYNTPGMQQPSGTYRSPESSMPANESANSAASATENSNLRYRNADGSWSNRDGSTMKSMPSDTRDYSATPGTYSRPARADRG